MGDSRGAVESLRRALTVWDGELTPTTGVGSAYRRIWRDRHRL
jgi:hypothetical protein